MTLINALSTLYEPYKKVYAMYPLNTLILINLLSKLYDLNKQNEKIKCVQSSSSSILDPRSSILHHPHPHPHRSNFRQSIMTIDVLSVIYERYEENA